MTHHYDTHYGTHYETHYDTRYDTHSDTHTDTQLTLPLTMIVFRWLPDRGYFLGKTFSILLIAYIPWLLASLHWLSFPGFPSFRVFFSLALSHLQSFGQGAPRFVISSTETGD